MAVCESCLARVHAVLGEPDEMVVGCGTPEGVVMRGFRGWFLGRGLTYNNDADGEIAMRDDAAVWLTDDGDFMVARQRHWQDLEDGSDVSRVGWMPNVWSECRVYAGLDEVCEDDWDGGADLVVQMACIAAYGMISCLDGGE